MRFILILIALSAQTSLLLGAGCDAFASPAAGLPARARHVLPAIGEGTIRMHPDDGGDDDRDGRGDAAAIDRRSALRLATTITLAPATFLTGGAAHAEDETMERGGVRLTPFNSLAFNYRGGESPTVNPASLDEPSIPYSEFLERLNSDQVAAVEFLAPNGDAAYATFKSSGGDGAVGAGGGRIRIGEGYPVEDPRGWSSPAFVVKAVARRGVPYKFVVPGLGDSFKEM